jgi:hypothetical protein
MINEKDSTIYCIWLTFLPQEKIWEGINMDGVQLHGPVSDRGCRIWQKHETTAISIVPPLTEP